MRFATESGMRSIGRWRKSRGRSPSPMR